MDSTRRGPRRRRVSAKPRLNLTRKQPAPSAPLVEAAADEGGASSMGGSNAGGSWYGSGPMSASQLMQIGRDRKQSTKPATVRVSPNRPKRDVKYIPGTDILMFGVDHLSTTY